MSDAPGQNDRLKSVDEHDNNHSQRHDCPDPKHDRCLRQYPDTSACCLQEVDRIVNRKEAGSVRLAVQPTPAIFSPSLDGREKECQSCFRPCCCLPCQTSS